MPVKESKDHRNDPWPNSWPSCEFGETLLGAWCTERGVVKIGGTLLCVSHATLVGLENRWKTLLHMVLGLDGRLKSAEAGPDELLVRRLRYQRDEAVEQLSITGGQLEAACAEQEE